MICPLPRWRERDPNGWGQKNFQSLGSGLWGAIPPVTVRGQCVVHSARHPKSFDHPYQNLLHTHCPLAGLSCFVAAGSGEVQAQIGRRGISFWGDSPGEEPV